MVIVVKCLRQHEKNSLCGSLSFYQYSECCRSCLTVYHILCLCCNFSIVLDQLDSCITRFAMLEIGQKQNIYILYSYICHQREKTTETYFKVHVHEFHKSMAMTINISFTLMPQFTVQEWDQC